MENRLFSVAMSIKLAITILICSAINCAGAQAKAVVLNDKFELKKVKFNTGFITTFNQDVDLSLFENEAGIQSGRYPVEVFLNSRKLKTYFIDFFDRNGVVIPCIPASVLWATNLDPDKLAGGWADKECVNMAEDFPGGTVNYDYENERLVITIPQVYLLEKAEGYIDPARWDEGINALSVNYALSGSNTFNQQNMYYGNLLTMLRLGAWRFNTYDALTGGSQQRSRFEHMQAYAQRAIAPILSEFSFGDLNTSGEFFDTTSLRGAILRSDERMLPWSVKGYAPEIRGIANSNAIVTVRQNNNVLFEQNVPPGEFNINNLIALGYGGDLDVTVTESSGRVRTFSVPYSSIPQLLRKGYFKYSVAGGHIRQFGLETAPSMLESTLQYGVSNDITLYGGMQTTGENTYSALVSGLAINTRAGALSADVTWSSVPQSISGMNSHNWVDNSRLKLNYAKLVKQTGTNFNIASYYLAGENFFTLNEALLAKQAQGVWLPERFRNRYEFMVSQILPPGFGEVSMSGWWEKNSRNADANSRASYLFSYRNNYNSISYSVNVNKAFTYEGKKDTSLNFNLSMPFGFRSDYKPRLRAAMSYSNDDSMFRTSVNGSHQGDDYASNFSAYLNKSSKTDSSFGINVGHTGSALHKSLSYSQAMNHSALAGSLSGGMLVHQDGIQLSSYLGDTLALIEAPQAEGAKIMGNKFSRIGENGYGIMSFLTPYAENSLALDVKGAAIGFDSEDDGLIVIPTAGAVIKAVFKNAHENSVLVKVKAHDGGFLPFGSRIYDKNKYVIGTLGQAGIAIVSLPKSYQPLEVKWQKNQKKMTCVIQPWDLQGVKKTSPGTITAVLLNCLGKKIKEY